MATTRATRANATASPLYKGLPTPPRRQRKTNARKPKAAKATTRARKPEPEPEPEAEPESAPEPEPELEPELESESASEQQPEPESEPEQEQAMELEPTPGSKPHISSVESGHSWEQTHEIPSPTFVQDMHDRITELVTGEADSWSEAIVAPYNYDEDREEAMELLRLADQKRKENLPLTKITVRPVQSSPVATTPPRARLSSAPSTPLTNGHASPAPTPQTESFFGRMFSSILPSIFTTPKSAHQSSPTKTPVSKTPVAKTSTTSSLKPSTPIAPPVIGELTMTLTPTPTSVGKSRGNSKFRQPSKRRERATIARNIASSVRDAAEQEQAQRWADAVLKQMLQGSSASTGEKRKRLEEGLTYGDLNHINSKPWKTVTSSFGLDDELMDHVDDTPDQPAPMWAVLEHLRIEMQERGQQNGVLQTGQEDDVDQRTPKRQKITPRRSSSSPFFNSGGKSTSLHDLHPRSALDRGDTSQDSNIFKRSQQQCEPQPQFETKQPVETQQDPVTAPFPTSFSFEYSDEEDQEDPEDTPASPTPSTNGNATTASGASATWTQAPPPAPVMTHAELPTSLSSIPSVPSGDGHLVSTPTVDRVEAQRARALKFTPHKPSNLSHMSKPSPSLRSDAGNESIIGDSPTPFNAASNTPAPSLFQGKSVGSGFNLFQNKSTSNDVSLQTTNLSNGASPFQSKSLANGTSSSQEKTTGNTTSGFQVKDASKGISDFMSAGPSLALPDFGFAFPDAETLDLPLDVEADAVAYAHSAELKARVKAMAWDDPIIEFDDEV